MLFLIALMFSLPAGATTYDRSVSYCSIDGRDIGRLLSAYTQCRVRERYDVWNRYLHRGCGYCQTGTRGAVITGPGGIKQ